MLINQTSGFHISVQSGKLTQYFLLSIFFLCVLYKCLNPLNLRKILAICVTALRVSYYIGLVSVSQIRLPEVAYWLAMLLSCFRMKHSSNVCFCEPSSLTAMWCLNNVDNDSSFGVLELMFVRGQQAHSWVESLELAGKSGFSLIKLWWPGVRVNNDQNKYLLSEYAWVLFMLLACGAIQNAMLFNSRTCYVYVRSMCWVL